MTKKIIVFFMCFFITTILTGCSVKLDSLEILEDPLTLYVGESKELHYEYEPYEESPKLVWKSSEPGVVSVENGKIHALSIGTSDITVSYGGLTSTVNVIVTTIENQFKSVFDKIGESNEILNEIATSIHDAWYFGINDIEKHDSKQIIQLLVSVVGRRIGTAQQFVDAYNIYFNSSSDEETISYYMQQGYFRIIITVRTAYYLGGYYKAALSTLDEVKLKMEIIDSTANGYNEIEAYYLKTMELYNYIYQIHEHNFDKYSKQINDLESQIQSLITKASMYV